MPNYGNLAAPEKRIELCYNYYWARARVHEALDKIREAII